MIYAFSLEDWPVLSCIGYESSKRVIDTLCHIRRDLCIDGAKIDPFFEVLVALCAKFAHNNLFGHARRSSRKVEILSNSHDRSWLLRYLFALVHASAKGRANEAR